MDVGGGGGYGEGREVNRILDTMLIIIIFFNKKKYMNKSRSISFGKERSERIVVCTNFIKLGNTFHNIYFKEIPVQFLFLLCCECHG